MNEIKIKLNGKSITLKFGSWVMMQLIESGYELANLSDDINKNPFKFIPKLLYLGACNGKSKNLNDFNEGDFFEFLDNVGLDSKELSDILGLFTSSIRADLPQEEVNEKGKVPKKK